MNVAGSPLERGKDDRVHQPDDRTGLFLRDLLDRDRFVAALVFTNQLELEAFGRFLQHALRGFRFLQQVLNFGKRSDIDDQRPAEQRRDFVDDDEIARIRHRNDERHRLPSCSGTKL